MKNHTKTLGKYAYLNGKIIPSSKACIHSYDLGLMRGMAVFDFLRFRNQKPIFLKEHLDRYFRSAKILNIPTVFTKEEYTKAISDLITKNKQENGTVRIILSAGPITSGFTITTPHVIILIEPYYELPQEYFEKGVKIITDIYDRPYPKAKHTHYLEAGILDSKKLKSKALEIVYIDSKGFVCEPSTSNICIIKKGILYTPKSNVLEGITLMYVLKTAKKLGIKCVIKDFKLKDLLNADEVFITATNKDVLPVIKIDSHIIADGKVGLLSKKILGNYRALTNSTN
jgi:branched-chain amino acid aminotransferase